MVSFCYLILMKVHWFVQSNRLALLHKLKRCIIDVSDSWVDSIRSVLHRRSSYALKSVS